MPPYFPIESQIPIDFFFTQNSVVNLITPEKIIENDQEFQIKLNKSLSHLNSTSNKNYTTI